jgi:PhzF family phenazine biosynthesis protein
MSRLDFSLVRVHEPGALVTVLGLDRDPGTEGPSLAASLPGSLIAFALPPRRDDCHVRVRTFTARRELPLSVEGALAVALAIGAKGPCPIEQGVIRSDAHVHEGHATLALDRPVLGTRTLDDRTLVAAAIGLEPNDLAPSLPIRSGSCGMLTLLIPVASEEALARASLHLNAWRRAHEKARPYAAVAFVATAHDRVPLRVLVPETGDDLASGTVCAALTAYLLQLGVRTPREMQTICFAQGAATSHTITARARGALERDGDLVVDAAVRRVGEGFVMRV